VDEPILADPVKLPIDPAEIETTIRRAVSEAFDVEIHRIVLLKPGALPKTSSGKLQRFASRAAYMDQTLALLPDVSATTMRR
jgi:acyl-CoA synthetase (AMP-forming)/AMP-acid ligase II